MKLVIILEGKVSIGLHLRRNTREDIYDFLNEYVTVYHKLDQKTINAKSIVKYANIVNVLCIVIDM